MDLTFVTCIYDLSKYRIFPTEERSFGYYLKFAKEFILKSRVNLCIFTSSDLAPILSELSYAKIYIVEFDDLSITKNDNLRKNYKAMFNKLIASEKDINTKFIPEQIFLYLSKFYFLERILEDNPYNTSHVGFIDFGINHRPLINENDGSIDILHQISKNPRPHLAFPIFQDDTIDDTTLFCTWMCTCSGGIITIPITEIDIIKQIRSQIPELIEQGYLPYDETLLYKQFMLNSKSMSCYKSRADYSTILTDYINKPDFYFRY
jgi:hypothetical protein